MKSVFQQINEPIPLETAKDSFALFSYSIIYYTISYGQFFHFVIAQYLLCLSNVYRYYNGYCCY